MQITFDQYKELRKQGVSPDQIRQSADKPRDMGLVGKVADILGIKDFGRGVASSMAGADVERVRAGAAQLGATQDRVLTQIKANRAAGKDSSRLKGALEKSFDMNSAADIEAVGTDGLTDREFLGSAAQTALNVALPGTPVGKTIKAKAAIGAAGGAAFGAAESYGKDGNVAAGALMGAAIGGVAGALIGVAQKAISAATKSAPETLMSKVVRQGRADLAAEATGKKPILARQMIEAGVKGSDEAIVSKSSTELAALERELTGLLERNQNTFVQTPHLMRSLDEVMRRKQSVFGEKGVEMIRTFKEVLRKKGDRLSLADANQLKRDIYKELSEASFNADVLPTNKEVLRTIASAIRHEMANTSQRIADINAKQQFHIRVIDNVERQLQNKGKLNLLGLSDTIFASAGVAGGEPVSAIGAGIAKRSIESTQFRTRAAIGLDKLGSLIDGLPTNETGMVSKQVLMNLIGEVSGDLTE